MNTTTWTKLDIPTNKRIRKLQRPICHITKKALSFNVAAANVCIAEGIANSSVDLYISGDCIMLAPGTTIKLRFPQTAEKFGDKGRTLVISSERVVRAVATLGVSVYEVVPNKGTVILRPVREGAK